MTDYQVDAFDRALGNLDGLPGVLRTRPSTVRAVTPLVGNVQTFIIQTVRHDDGDTVFLEVASSEGHYRLVLPSKVSAVIARQRDSLTHRARSRAAREQAVQRKAAGIKPFVRKEEKTQCQ